jgi:Protein of unknown function (DUF2877)
MVQLLAGLTVPRSPSSPASMIRGSVTVMTGAASPRSLIVTGVASLAVRQPLTGPRGPARMVAVGPDAVYLELPASVPEPRVLVVVAADASRLPNAVAVAPEGLDHIAAGPGDGEAWVGRGTVQAGELTVRVLRWWDPSPVLGPLSRVRVEQGAAALHRACVTANCGASLAGDDAPAALADCCADGDLAGAVEAAEQMVGLGLGLVPGGDNMISGLLLALRLLGGAISGGTRAVWLADWLGAAVTSDAARRTTSLGATLLYCAAHGQASAEVSAVLHGLAGQEPLGPATRALLATGRTPSGQALSTGPGAGADLAWGLVAGCRAAVALASPIR